MLKCLASNCPANETGFHRQCDQTRHIKKCAYAKGFIIQQRNNAKRPAVDPLEPEAVPKRMRSGLESIGGNSEEVQTVL
jgi:hypothetical protein